MTTTLEEWLGELDRLRSGVGIPLRVRYWEHELDRMRRPLRIRGRLTKWDVRAMTPIERMELNEGCSLGNGATALLLDGKRNIWLVTAGRRSDRHGSRITAVY